MENRRIKKQGEGVGKKGFSFFSKSSAQDENKGNNGLGNYRSIEHEFGQRRW